MNTAIVGLKLIKEMGNYVDNGVLLEGQDEIISRLKFIGLIQRDEKINVRHVQRQQNNFFTKLSRSFIFPDNRWNTLKFVKDVVLRAFDILNQHLQKGNLLQAKSIMGDLIRAQKGIVNMKYTYSEDSRFCCDMDVLIENIHTRIDLLLRSYPELRKGEPLLGSEKEEEPPAGSGFPSVESKDEVKVEKGEKEEKEKKRGLFGKNEK